MVSSTTPFLGVWGASGSGKTRLIEQLVPIFRQRGLRVGTVKHATHRPALDVPGKDSHRHAEAGAERVLLLGPGCAILFIHTGADPELEPWRAQFDNVVDLVIVEGFRATPQPHVRIDVHDGPDFSFHTEHVPHGPRWVLRRPCAAPEPFGYPSELVERLAHDIAAVVLP